MVGHLISMDNERKIKLVFEALPEERKDGESRERKGVIYV